MGPSVDNRVINQTPYSGAAPLCVAYGGTIAALSQLHAAYQRGMHRYRWGWVNDGVKR